MDPKYIRNFSIIAHIDHGKSTLADRILELTGAVTKREMRDQVLDDMELERERGITIKAHTVTIWHMYQGQRYQLNLIDTPGHVDFHYEVEKSLQACEGALLLVDAAQGVAAQTVANAYLAIEADLSIVTVLNKIDLAHARPEEVAEEIEHAIGIDATDSLAVSAKTGVGVKAVLDAVIERMPPPPGNVDAPLRALIFDAVYNEFRGIIVYLRIVDGTIRKGDRVKMMGTGKVYEAVEIGHFVPKMRPTDELGVGEVGYFISNIKRLGDVRVGDTMTLARGGASKMLPGYRVPSHMVYADFYPTAAGDFESLREALDTLCLSDSSFSYEPVTSDALGFGFRCGFLGLLHMEIIQQRLEREHDLDMIQTAPTVTYRIEKTGGEVVEIHSPGQLPEPDKFERLLEPIARATILVPAEYVGVLMQICTDHRGVYVRQEYLSTTRVQLTYDLPLAEIIYDFYDKLKSSTRGYGTLNYEIRDYQADDLVKMRILVNRDEVDALSVIVHKDHAEQRGRAVIKKLRKESPRHLFEVSLQAAIGSRIIARENIAALRKDVTAKCYGGDITRKRKLLEKQKAGKRRMRQIGNVEIPQKAFLAVLGGTGEGKEGGK
jgi:GTP-binding protein LepA